MTDHDSAVRVEIAHDPAIRRWEARLDDAVVGYAEYRLTPGLVTFTHTVVEPGHEGQGIASALARRALDDAIAHALRIRPACSFIRTYIKRHPAYAEHVAVTDPD